MVKAPSPFLSWAGGKRRLVRRLVAALPIDFRERTYHEPFLGAASLFLFTQPRRAILSDANYHLMDCYRFVRSRPDLVHRYLQEHAAYHSHSHYLRARELYNHSHPSSAQAARFIYLNKSCFNGIFRVNKQGQFNVPFGNKSHLLLPTLDDLRVAGTALRRARLRAVSFESSLENLGSHDFAYIDPPYPPLNGTSYFAHYTIDRFTQENQERLADALHRLDRRRARFLMSNADTPLIRHLYRRFSICSVSVTRFVTCKATKHRVGELIIANYDQPENFND